MANAIQAQSRADNISLNNDKLNYANGQKNLGNSKLSKDGFMQLLLAQLKSQDPTNPVSDKELVQQQAALTQIESIEELSKTLKSSSQLTQAIGLSGKGVSVKGDDGLTVSGIVSQVSLSDKGTGITVNGKTYTTSQIQTLFDATTPTQ
jgi:flagellar basal-body rod modification protein FlgD